MWLPTGKRAIEKHATKSNLYRLHFKGSSFTFGSLEEAVAAQTRAKGMLRSIKSGMPVPPNVERLALWIISGGKKGLARHADAESRPIEWLVEEYKNYEKGRVNKTKANNGISVKHYESILDCLTLFLKFTQTFNYRTIREALDELTLMQYKTEYLPNHTTRRDHYHPIKKIGPLIEYAYGLKYLNKYPRTLKKFLKVGRASPPAETFSVEEIQQLWNAADERMRLYIALGLNCGYKSKDIATLQRSMLKDGTHIDRLRHKTGIPNKSKLWQLTARMLAEQMEKEGDTLLLQPKTGRPLHVDVLVKSKTHYTEHDSIKRSFDHLRKKCKMGKGKTFSLLRKTGATWIANQYARPHTFSRTSTELSVMYLAHSQKGEIKRYVKESADELYAATDSLYTYFSPYLSVVDPSSSNPVDVSS